VVSSKIRLPDARDSAPVIPLQWRNLGSIAKFV